MRAMTSPFDTIAPEIQPKHVISGNKPTVLTDIYQDDINIVIWKRDIADRLIQSAYHIISAKPTLHVSCTVTQKNVYTAMKDVLNTSEIADDLIKDISQLVDMFCCLFDLKRAGLRLTALDRAMCPRFHVDRVPCRLVTTYLGESTQWLPHHLVDRSKLGAGNQGKTDEQSGLFKESAEVEQLNQGDIALLKGELWQGNENAGLVHRSPHMVSDIFRLLLTLDYIND